MFAIHSGSEAQWNNHGRFVDQDESPHSKPNHLDPMELACPTNAFESMFTRQANRSTSAF